jgi:hypothetical protein
VSVQRDTNSKVNTSDLLSSINIFLGKTSPDINKTHDDMNKYMRDILGAIGKVFFDISLNKIKNTAKNTTNPYDESRWVFANLAESKKIILLDHLAEATKFTLNKKIETKITDDLIFNSLSTTKPDQRKYIPVSYLDDLHIGNFKGPLYYALRTETVKNITELEKVFKSSNSNTKNYFVQQAVDLYIKTCYPVIIYDYIDCMLNLYTKYGDFVNSRIALLAKVMFTYYIMKIVSELYSQSGTITDANSNLLSQIISKLSHYLQNINNIDMTYKNTNMMKTIVGNLHDTSSKVVDKNTELQKIKEDIKNNQISLRNILANANDLNEQYKVKLVENIILICLLITVLVVCTTLLMLKSETNKFQLIVTYIVGCVAIALLIYYVIVLVAKLIKNSKKSY